MSKVGVAAKIGAILFVLWGILHIWVGWEGVKGLSKNGNDLWPGLIGGANMPVAKFQFTKDRATENAHKHLLINFLFDVSGYGFLGLLVAQQVWVKGSWLFFLMGVFLIGLADMSFLILQVYPGQIIGLTFESVVGPLLWFLALLITPFGLPPFNLDELSAEKKKAM